MLMMTSQSKAVTFAHFLMPVIRFSFRKIYGTDSEKSSKVLISGPKIPALTPIRM